MSDAACAKCQTPESQLAQALKRCARCRQIRYCSANCQRADWPEHKRQCPRPSPLSDPTSSPRLRATCRLAFGNNLPAEDDTIFFLEKSIPHLDDITMAGPFYPRRALLEQFKSYFHRKSSAGLALISDFDHDEEGLRRLVHVNAPLDHDPSKVVFIRIIPQHNPTMASRLPGSAYNVISTVPLLPHELAERGSGQVASPYPRVKEMEVHGCYSSADEANAKGAEVIRLFEHTLAQPRRAIGAGDGMFGYGGERLFTDAIFGQGHHGQFVAVAVAVTHETGEVRYPDE